MVLSDLKVELFGLTFTLLLILIQADFLGIQSNGIDAIASGPEMIASIGLRL